MEDNNFDINKEESYLRAKKKVNSIKGFYKHLVIYIIVNLFLIGVKYFEEFSLNENFWVWKNLNMIFLWGIGLGVHFISVFGFSFILGKNWEEQKIKELMDKENKHN
jgi:hypothetical protein